MQNWNVLPPGAAFTLSAKDTRQTGTPNFSFVINVGKLVEADRFLLAPGHELRRATAEEMSEIRARIRTLASNGEYMIAPWEQTIDPNGQWVELPEEQWRYFVISFEGTNQTVEALSEAFMLASSELRIAFTTIAWKGTVPALIMNAQRLFMQLEEARWGHVDFLDIKYSDIQEIIEINARLQNHAHPAIDMHRYTRELQQLEALPKSSPLLFLGYFGLLESLLTHQPDLRIRSIR